MLVIPSGGSIATEQPFDRAELDRRLAAVRKGMEERRADILLITDPHDMYYLPAGVSLAV